MPSLLQLNCTANWGSTGKIAEGIGLAAMARGWESAIAFGRYLNPSQSQLMKVGSQTDVYLHYARYRLFNDEGLGSRRATRQLIGRIENYAPDVIHLHNIHGHWLNYPLLFEYLGSISTPIVWTLHDCWSFTGGCYHFENAGCFKWKNNCHQCGHRLKFQSDNSARNFLLKKHLFQAVGKRLTIVCVSEWLAKYVRQSLLGNCRIEVINNGIDTSVFTPSEDANHAPSIAGVSNVWTSEKGLDDFIELRRLLPEDIGITMVGLTSGQIADLPPGITGLCRTQSVDELVKIYRSANILVNPTYNDTFPTVNLEALACGTPVITYNTGGSPEAIDHSTGIVIEKGNIEQLAATVAAVCNGALKFSSDECRARAIRNFSQTTQFGRYIDLYHDLIR